jgi:hypothetical protein
MVVPFMYAIIASCVVDTTAPHEAVVERKIRTDEIDTGGGGNGANAQSKA